MKQIGRMLFAAALLGTTVAGRAWAICATNSFVSSTVTQTSLTTWFYAFSVQNGCRPNHQQLMTDFYLPYFSDEEIGPITLPAPDTRTTTSTITWSDAIQLDNDLFNLPGAGVIDFHVNVDPELEEEPGVSAPGVGYYSATGFGFTADFAPIEGPDAIRQTPFNGTTFGSSVLLFGDPPIPASPLTIAALTETATPEPGTLTLMAIGLFLIVPVLRRRGRRVRPHKTLANTGERFVNYGL